MVTHPGISDRVSSALTQDASSIARLIDSTRLKADTTNDQVIALCEEAAHYGFASVFVHPSQLALAVSILRSTPVRVGTPIGFPLGADLSTVKRFQAEEALRLGADELDMVLNVAALKSGDRSLVQTDITAVVQVGHDAGAIVKVILETGLLTLEEKLLACQLCLIAGADFIKTSTGLHGGATTEDIVLIRGVVGEKCGVKASGGVRTLADVHAMVEAGADRIGTSAAAAIMREISS